MDEKIKYLLQRLSIAQSNEEKENLVRLALRAQDMDTRHACGKAINKLSLCRPVRSSFDTISRDEAMNAIINCKGGVE